MFNHCTSPIESKTWRITEDSLVPSFLHSHVDPRPECTILQQGDGIIATGKRVPLGDTVQILERNASQGILYFLLSLDAGVFETDIEQQTRISQQMISLDTNTAHLVESRSGNSVHRLYYMINWKSELRRLAQQFGTQNLTVFLLGSIEGAKDDSRQILGLLLNRVSDRGNDGETKATYCRLGYASGERMSLFKHFNNYFRNRWNLCSADVWFGRSLL